MATHTLLAGTDVSGGDSKRVIVVPESTRRLIRVEVVLELAGQGCVGSKTVPRRSRWGAVKTKVVQGLVLQRDIVPKTGILLDTDGVCDVVDKADYAVASSRSFKVWSRQDSIVHLKFRSQVGVDLQRSFHHGDLKVIDGLV